MTLKKQLSVVSMIAVFCSTSSAVEQLPINIEAKSGQTVYLPATPPINLNEEVRIQQVDQNITRHGQAK